jgi:glycosyltransferase involved in cell wall biosynthesis
MRVLVMTIVHHPLDARIYRREIGALLAAGHDVTYAAPYRATGAATPTDVATVDLPSARGRRRLHALRAARQALRDLGPTADVVLLHDPELLLALPGLRLRRVVWDVHEDTAAAVAMKPWLPRVLRAPAAGGVRVLERFAERRVHVILAEDGYRERFRREHPVVPNSVVVPATPPAPPGSDRVIYVGSVTKARGAEELMTLGRLLRPDGVTVEVVGEAEGETRARLAAADAAGDVRWHGFVPNAKSMAMLDGALAGLSLLHDQPNYAHSMPTKVLEYMAHGLPVVTTPNPLAEHLVRASGGGVVVAFGDTAATADAVRRLRADETLRRHCAEGGYRLVREHYDWAVDGARFAGYLAELAAAGPL